MQDYIVGIDVGGTTIKLAAFPVGEKADHTWEIPTPVFEHIDEIWQAMADSIWEKFDEFGIDRAALKAVGMCLPGPIRDDGYIPRCVNLGMGACYPEKILGDILGVPVKAGNDATIAALGEVYYGAAKGYQSAVMITLGTGVGGGIITNGQAIHGPHGVAGEVGHFVVNPDETLQCNCGNYGCLEQYASATGIVRTARRLMEKGGYETKLVDTPDLSCKMICDAAKEGDPLALEVIEVFGKYMGIAVSHLVLVNDPEVIIIGGGVSRAGQILIDAIKKYTDKYSHIAENYGDIVLATLGNDAGAYGCAALAMGLLK